jgi:hypothetical protein
MELLELLSQYVNLPTYDNFRLACQSAGADVHYSMYDNDFLFDANNFIYVSIDREGKDKRNVYDANWNPLYFSWAGGEKGSKARGEEIPPPEPLEKMKEFGSTIARRFKYVRVVFYDADGQLFFGEITLHHGGGYNHFIPSEYDLIYGQRLKL